MRMNSKLARGLVSAVAVAALSFGAVACGGEQEEEEKKEKTEKTEKKKTEEKTKHEISEKLKTEKT